MDRRFPRSHRILQRRDFQRVMREGRRVTTRNLIVFADAGKAQFPRLGLAVGRRVGKAAVRNRWRRLMREVFRLKLKDMLPAIDLVVAVKSARDGVRRAPSLESVRQELLEAVERLVAGMGTR